jgi:hypothetical protein
MEQYAHTLIPDDIDFVPKSNQVAAFLDGLVELGAAPLQAKLKVRKLSGQLRIGRHPLTGETLSIPRRDQIAVENVSDVLPIINALDDYDVVMTGQGPPRLMPFRLRTHDVRPRAADGEAELEPLDRKKDFIECDYKGTYAFDVECCLRRELVSTSDPHPEMPSAPEVPEFGQPCTSKNRGTAFFRNPRTAVIMQVPKAGCARFWIAFELGRFVFPEISDTLSVLHPSIVQSAKESFGVTFIQGCYLL